MKTVRSILFTLLASASLLAPAASQAETIFERFAPPLPPLPHIVIRSSPEYVYREDYRDDYRYRRPPPPRHHHHHGYRGDDRRDDGRRWR